MSTSPIWTFPLECRDAYIPPIGSKGSIETIRKNIVEYRDKNKGVLLISAELEEILTLSDRILVMYEGKIVGDLDSKNANEENVGFLMTGGKEKDVI